MVNDEQNVVSMDVKFGDLHFVVIFAVFLMIIVGGINSKW